LAGRRHWQLCGGSQTRGARPGGAAAGYTLTWSGQYEAMERVRERLKSFCHSTVPDLLFSTSNAIDCQDVAHLLAVPFSAVGAIWLLFALGYNMSIGVWVV